MAEYQVKLTAFEGPLDLLLMLIEKEELAITEVSLAQVTGQYIAYLEENEKQIPLENLAFFLAVAAKLLLIKSKALLPILTFTEEEEEEIADLKEHLAWFQKYQQRALWLGEVMGKQPFLTRETFLGPRTVYVPPAGVTGETLREALVDFLSVQESVKEALPEQTLRKILSLEKRIVDIKARLHKQGTTAFRSLLSKNPTRDEIVVSFLALLELVKQKTIIVEQESLFAEMNLKEYS